MTKQRLKEYLWLKRNIKQLEMQLDEIDTRLTKTTKTISDMPRNKTPKDLTNDLLAHKVDMQNALNRKLTTLYVELDVIETAVAQLPPKEQCFIRMRYIEGKSRVRICYELNYSERQISRIQKAALTTLSAI